MHAGIIHIYDNINVHNETVSYYYRIKPINSLFASETQCATLLEDMIDIIQNINMPGAIIIKPTKIDNNKIYKAYADNFKKYGNPAFFELAKDYILSLKEILSSAIKYRYEIYFVFCDGRDELKKKMPIKLFRPKNDPLEKRMLDLYQIIEVEIFKKLNKTIQAVRLNEDQVEKLINYLSVPIDNAIVDYYVEENPSDLKYRYLTTNSHIWKELYTRTHVVSSFEKLKVEKSSKADDVINSMQLESYPSDIIVKFDLDQTAEFRKNMRAKKDKISKDQKRFFSLAERKDKDMTKAEAIAKIGEDVDPSIEGSKIKFQMFVRLRSNSKELLDKRSEFLRTKFDSKDIILTYEVGKQIDIANNLLPYRVTFTQYINTTDLAYFARYNFLGGLYIGDEEEGMIMTYTVPGGIPIFHDLSKPLLGKTKTSSPVAVFVGETGAGKTQLADLEAFQNMIFKGMKILIIDPKGDREKKIELLGEQAAHLKIGSKDCQDGMFDPYLMADSYKDALAQVQRDIDGMVHALKLGKSNFSAIEKAHFDMLEDKKKNRIKQCTLTYLLEEKLPKYDEEISHQVLTLKHDPMMRLFFANQDTKYDSAFNLNKPFNLITFDKLPVDIIDKGDFNPNRLDHAIFSMIFSRVQGIINNFMKAFGNSENIVVFDEYKVYQKTPGGEAVVDNTTRQARSWLTHVFLITQELSSISSDILNNVGEIFVGSLKSSKEIEYILTEMKLDNHPTVKGALIDRTEEEGVSEGRKYNFLMQDYNNRKCLTKNKIPRCFMETFRTLKDEENVPVTGTFLNNQKGDMIYDE